MARSRGGIRFAAGRARLHRCLSEAHAADRLGVYALRDIDARKVVDRAGTDLREVAEAFARLERVAPLIDRDSDF